MGHTSTIRMGAAKWVYKFFEGLAISIWGISLIDVIALLVGSGGSLVSGIDDTVKIVMAIVGAVYFIVKAVIELPHKYRMQRLEYKKKMREVEEEKKGGRKAAAP